MLPYADYASELTRKDIKILLSGTDFGKTNDIKMLRDDRVVLTVPNSLRHNDLH